MHDNEPLTQLGSEWQPSPTEGSVIHGPTGIEFVVVSGGSMDRGLTPADVAALARVVDWGKRLAEEVERIAAPARPVHTVQVATFLCSRRLVDASLVQTHCPMIGEGAVSRADATALAQQLGFRLPSEVELEWLSRDGTQATFTLGAARLFELESRDERLTATRWGVEELNQETWAADDWHPSYEGAPLDAAPWLGGEACGVTRGGFWLPAMQSEEELLLALAARRQRGGRAARVRLVRQLG